MVEERSYLRWLWEVVILGSIDFLTSYVAEPFYLLLIPFLYPIILMIGGSIVEFVILSVVLAFLIATHASYRFMKAGGGTGGFWYP